jgi:hypothetical protein
MNQKTRFPIQQIRNKLFPNTGLNSKINGCHGNHHDENESDEFKFLHGL